LENGSPTRLPKVSPRKDGAATGSAGRCIDRGIGEKHATFRQFVEVGSLGDVVDSARSLDLGINGCLPAPVIGKGKKDIGPFASQDEKRRYDERKKNKKTTTIHTPAIGASSGRVKQEASNL
jgi:hypothetical protein